MAREYAKRRALARRGGAHPFLVGVVTFLLGYVSASFFDAEALLHWVNNQVLAHQEMNKDPVKVQRRQAEIPPKPKFEFYTLLTNEKGPNAPSGSSHAAAEPVTRVNEAAVKTAAQTIKPSASSPQQVMALKPAQPRGAIVAPVVKGSYSVQVAAFKSRHDAEHMKGLLILKGFNVNVVPVVHASKGTWFRVMVGPYANRNLAQQAQLFLARNERLHGMITSG